MINDDEAFVTIRVTFVLGIEPSWKHVFCAMRKNSNLNVLLSEFDHISIPILYPTIVFRLSFLARQDYCLLMLFFRSCICLLSRFDFLTFFLFICFLFVVSL